MAFIVFPIIIHLLFCFDEIFISSLKMSYMYKKYLGHINPYSPLPVPPGLPPLYLLSTSYIFYSLYPTKPSQC